MVRGIVLGIALGILLSVAVTSTAASDDELFVARRWLMGTELRLVIVDVDADPAAVAERCFAIVADLEESLSTWIPTSPLSRVNASAGQRIAVSDAIAAYLERCIEDHRRTEGAFDPSVGTWRGLEAQAARPPIGMDRIVIERAPGATWVTLPYAGYALDSGGNGKGIAVDRVVEELRRSAVESALIDFGGSSWYGLGRPPQAEHWTVSVPGVGTGAAREVELRDRALSVSATYLEDVDAQGQPLRRAHIVDPRTGVAIEVQRVAVVSSASAEDAEVLSTALIVEGEAGLRFVARYAGAEAFVVEAAETD